MISEELGKILPLIEQLQATFAEDYWPGVERFAETHDELEFLAMFRLDEIRLPPVHPEQALPLSHIHLDLQENLESVDRAIALNDPSAVIVPEGMTLEQMVLYWDAFDRFLHSGAPVWSDRLLKVALAQEMLSHPDIESHPLVILDEELRVIVGLDWCWAMAELGDYEYLRVVILRGAHPWAGLDYEDYKGKQHMSTLWSLEERRDWTESLTDSAREYAESLGWRYHRDTVTLTCSPRTLDRLGVLIRKQLGGKTKLDPAQLLFAETLRESILDLRERLIREGRTAGDVKAKLALHLKEEREMMARGSKIEQKNGWRWQIDDEGYFTHPAVARYRFKLLEEPTTASKTAEKSVVDDPHLMPLSQFQILARTHFGLEPEAAANVYKDGSPEDFNRRLKQYVKTVAEVAPKTRDQPDEAERQRQKDRLAMWRQG